MISGLAHAGVRVPDGFATTADAYREFLAYKGLAAAHRAGVSHRSTSTTWRSWRAPAPGSATGSSASRYRPLLEAAIRDAYGRMLRSRPRRRGRRALLGDRRGPAGCFLRRPAGDLPQHPRPRPRDRGHEAGVRLAVQRSRDLLPGAQGLRSIGRSRCRPGSSAWCAARLGASGVMFTLDTESGFDGTVFITSAYGLGETVVQGRSTRTSSTCSSTACAKARRRSCGATWATRRSR